MTISTKLNQILLSKAAIKTAIENKGLDMSNVPFNDFGTKIGEFDYIGEPPGELWTPEGVGAALWLDASDLSTIVKNESNVISEWRDKSTNNRHAIAYNGLLHYYDSELGKWVVRFDGLDDYLTYDGSFFINSNWTIICMFRKRSNKNYNTILAGGATTTGINMTFGAAEYPTFSMNNWGSGINTGWRTDSVDEILLMSGVKDTLSRLFINGIEMANGSILTLTSYPNPQIGKSQSVYLLADILELICFNSAIGDDLLKKTEGYLSHKWANVIKNHPYAKYPPKVTP